ncbi:hypothetical protein L211DRAFT_88470 [Terfezia boudieri ATCC MYA-4762]|uniref:Uncharacterized protein n=1 Tax=Terfezia boudieri ATCC MYA-4762 TaxID=1051890 RepID=A0A3N4LRI7_9PEZI|nr:hypothetical protein L211DRAFT_88470 [Terfezia boudieri ATCC MYA-4762]
MVKEKNLGYHTAHLVMFWNFCLFVPMIFPYFSYFFFCFSSFADPLLSLFTATHSGEDRSSSDYTLRMDGALGRGGYFALGEEMSNFLYTLSIDSGNGEVQMILPDLVLFWLFFLSSPLFVCVYSWGYILGDSVLFEITILVIYAPCQSSHCSSCLGLAVLVLHRIYIEALGAFNPTMSI